ncbi:DNA polymerase Y family protein [uncultured Jatrophihabitans sp.]|uniref:DNA polymerase Y family protein n=1 Tax=uncultured Jatrophihabitans sp. TaxID=1610747 RepID=UPI0035CB0E0C
MTAARVDAGLGEDVPIAVVTANRVVACSHAAREHGVQRGLKRREAQSRCPELTVLGRDEAIEARTFEPVVAALEAIAPGVEITRPGLAAIGVRGPTRYFGGETGVLHALSRGVHDIAALQIGGQRGDVLIGIADGSFAAEQAARRGVIVEPGGSPDFLAELPVETLDPAGTSTLVDLLTRLGIRTLGAFAALPPRDVLARFGPDGAWAHRQAGGVDERPVSGRRPPVEFTVTLDLEPAVDRVDTVAFSARGVAEQFVLDLAAHGLACTCLELQALSENGEETVRRWRHSGVLTAVDVLDRVRWQLEGWLSGRAAPRGACDPRMSPSGGVSRLRLVPIETVPTGAHQRALWGGAGDDDERAARALSRVQTLLGHGSVLMPVLEGGRDPGQRTRLVSWGDEPLPLRSPEQPWPGQLPAPAPSVLLDPPQPAQVLDADRRPVVVTDRGAVPAPPALFAMGGETPTAIASWAGPWPVDERWWSPESARRAVRCQVVDVRGRAFLVSGIMTPQPHWQVDAIYD